MDNRIDKAAAFDTLFTNNRIQILKTLAYYIDPHLLKGLAVYIKFLELQYTLALFRKHPETALHSFPLSSDGSSLAGELCSDLMPLCDETQKASLQQVTQMLDNIHNFQEMMDMAKSMHAPFQNFPYVFVLFHNYDLFFMPYGPRLPCFRFCGLYFRGAEYKQDFRTKKSAATYILRLIYLSEPEGPRSWLFSDPLP